MTKRALGILAVLALVGCGRQRQFDYYDFDYQKPVGYPQLVFKASMIVVGTVRRVDLVRSGVPARKAPDLLLDEMRASLDVENVLRGDWSQPRLDLTYFTYSRKNQGGYNGPGPIVVEADERRLFFLTRDSGEFRSVADVRGDYTVRVWTGRHPSFRRSEPPSDGVLSAIDSRAVGDDISAILLDIGEGANPEAMAASLGKTTWISEELATRKATVTRLRKLTAEGHDRSLRLEACSILAGQYAGQSGCIQQLDRDTSLSPAERNRVLEMLDKSRKRDARWKDLLRTRPMYAFSLDSVTALRDELELLLDHPDPEMGRLACAVRRQLFGDAPASCATRP